MTKFKEVTGNIFTEALNPTRRKLLQATAAGLVAGTASPLLSRNSPALAVEPKPGKALVAYFSRTGNTRAVAQHIHDLVGGDIVEIRTVDPYPQDYRATTDQAKREQETNARPRLASDVADTNPYNTVFIGYPNWWSTLPMALFTFLEKHDFAGKTVVPFCTHEGSGLGRGPNDIQAYCPNATVLEGLALRGGAGGFATTEAAQERVTQWLRKLNILSAQN